MKKEEFLAMSLPFGLKMYKESLHGEIETPYTLTPEWLESALEFKNKPILRPLSDLTKLIEHNGEKFMPIEILKDVFMLEWCDLFDDSIDAILEFAKYNNFKKIEYLPFCIVQNLVEWKFDIAGLIEKGEAIDVNTLTENPYK